MASKTPSLEELAKTVQELRDLEELRHLKANYCHLVDARSWDELSELFTEDAVCDYGFFGQYKGREEVVHGFFQGAVAAASSFMVHMVHNPVIEVKGDRATAKWYLTAQTTNLPSNRAVWVMGIYHDRFERVKGRWRIASITFEFKYFTPFEEGWAKTPIWDTTS